MPTKNPRLESEGAKRSEAADRAILARRFLETLAPDEHLTFQTFSDRPELKVKRSNGRIADPYAKILHGTFDQHQATLEQLNAQGAGIYVMVNEGDGRGRAAKNVVRTRALFIDTDGAPFPADLPLEPHLIVQSSPHRYHLYWLADGLLLDSFYALQKALAECYGTDPAVCDLPRVMRLPGSYHRKAEPQLVELLSYRDEPPYTPAEIFAAWPFLTEKLEHNRVEQADRERRRDEYAAEAKARRALPTADDRRDRRRALALLDAHFDRVANAADGSKHNTLRASARTLGGYVEARYLSAAEVTDRLTDAATVGAYDAAKAADAIAWGLKKGAEEPLLLEDTTVHAPMTRPPPPSTPAASSQPPPEPEAPWNPLQPLPGLYPPVPELPPELIPEPLQPWLIDIAERASLPLEFVACPALVTLSAVTGRSVGIYPKRRDDWLVVPNLWGGIVGKPGVMKSAAISEPTKPLRVLAARARDAHQEAQADAEAQRARLELEVSALKEQAKRDAKKGGIADDFQATLRTLTGQLTAATVTERRYLTQDATVEKLGELLQENPNGLLVLRDELAGWLRTLERPGREGEREFYLEAWNGTGGFTFDRIGRGTVHIDALTVSMLGAIQPGKLDKYLSEAIAGGGGADGLLQRFQLVVYPDKVGEYRHVDRHPNTAARQHVNAIFEALDSPDLVKLGLDAQEGEVPALHFADDAQDLFDTWRTELEQRLRSTELDHKPAFASHVAKYRSLMPSLALIFHLVAAADGTASGPVSLAAAQLAAAWCEYLEAHALKLYAAEVSGHVRAAQELKAKLDEGVIQDHSTVRDVYNAGWAGLTDRATVLAGLEVLAKCNWVRLEEHSTGGRPSQTVRLHPELRGDAK